MQSQRLECSFKQLLDEYGESEIPIGQAAERIMRDVAKEDSNLPGIYSPECEYQLSSIFVDTEMSMVLLLPPLLIFFQLKAVTYLPILDLKNKKTLTADA